MTCAAGDVLVHVLDADPGPGLVLYEEHLVDAAHTAVLVSVVVRHLVSVVYQVSTVCLSTRVSQTLHQTTLGCAAGVVSSGPVISHLADGVLVTDVGSYPGAAARSITLEDPLKQLLDVESLVVRVRQHSE